MEPLESKALMQIAPNDLKIHRSNRYDGTGLSISLVEFSPNDQERIQTIYQKVNAVYHAWLHHGKDLHCGELMQRLSAISDHSFFQLVCKLGKEEYEVKGGNSRVKKLHRALHDIRGGCLNGLLGITQLINEMGGDENWYQRAVYMARDHAKIMRNILVDIDPNNREDDESIQSHHIDHFTEKLKNLAFEYDELKLSTHLYCTYQGNISNCCLETSSIDRILFNFINNAAKYSANHEANVYIYPVNEMMIRWVFENPVSDEHLQWFNANCDETFWDLILSNRTYKGQGIGLYTCAEIVGNSFGVSNAESAVKDGYIGAKLEDKKFFSWFHWPVLSNN